MAGCGDNAVVWLSPEVWACVGSKLNGDDKRAARLVCRASRDGVSETVTHIYIDDPPTVPPAGLLRSLPAVKYLRLTLWSTSGEQAASLFASLAATSHVRRAVPPYRPLLHSLEELSLCLNKSSSGDLGHAACALANLVDVAKLRSLSVRGLGKPWEAGDYYALALIGQALATSPAFTGLQSLALNLRCPRVVEHVAHALPSLRNLTSLNLSYNFIDEDGAAQLAGVLSHTARPLAQLQALNLEGSRLGGAGTGALTRALATATHMAGLRDLRMEMAGIDEDGAGHLAELLRSAQHLSGLTCLELYDNSWGTEGTRTLMQAVQAATHLHGLRGLAFGGDAEGAVNTHAVADALSGATHLSSLHELRLRGDCRSDDGVLRLSEVLRAATWLRELKVLELHGQNVSTEEVVHLAQTLREATHLATLTSLCLVFNTASGLVPETSGFALLLTLAVQGATHLVNLRHLTLNTCGAANAFVASCVAAAPHLTTTNLQLQDLQ